jgi:hypothetical protein
MCQPPVDAGSFVVPCLICAPQPQAQQDHHCSEKGGVEAEQPAEGKEARAGASAASSYDDTQHDRDEAAQDEPDLSLDFLAQADRRRDF